MMKKMGAEAPKRRQNLWRLVLAGAADAEPFVGGQVFRVDPAGVSALRVRSPVALVEVQAPIHLRELRRIGDLLRNRASRQERGEQNCKNHFHHFNLLFITGTCPKLNYDTSA